MLTGIANPEDIKPLKVKDPTGKEFVVMPIEEMTRSLKMLQERHKPMQLRIATPHTVDPIHSLETYQTPIKNQMGRGTCWAFAGMAALEAAYKRKYGVTLDLSEQYLFHMCKATELYGDYMTNAVGHENNSAYWGGQGNSGIIEALSRLAVPEERFAPYEDQPVLDTIKTTTASGSLDWNSTQEQLNAFEYDLRHIPQDARHNAKYKVKGWSAIGYHLQTFHNK